MRLPGSVNVKGAPVPCRILEANWRRYDLALFESLLDVTRQRSISEPFTYGVPELLKADMACIKAAASGVPEGHRNFWLGRITKYLQREGYTQERAWKVVLAWNKLNEPPEKPKKLYGDFKAYWHGSYKLLGCLQDTDKQAILAGYCTGAECELRGTIGRLELDNAIALNNRLFRAYHNLTGNDLIVLAVLNRHPKGLNTSQLVDKLTARATKKPCMSMPTLQKSLATLEGRSFIRTVQGNRRAGQENFYRTIPQGTCGKGYTLVTNGAVNGAIDGRVTSAEFKLYVLLLKYAFGKGQCFPSLATLSKELRVDEGPISRQLKALDKADYIDRHYGYEGNEFKLVFRLLV